MFQLTFAVITAALISGAIADRVKLSAWIVFLPLWVTLVLLPARAHGVGRRLDLPSTSHAQDYAGGTVVHINAGVAGWRAGADHRASGSASARTRCGRTT